MASIWIKNFIKYGGATAIVGGSVGGYVLSNPHLTQRSFDEPPPFTHDFPESDSRQYSIEQLKKNHSTPDQALDMLVIGGGATGSGVALDAASRGLKVALVEKEDYACGASSKSTKLLHGGVRYLEKAVYQLDPDQLHLVMEALKERCIVIHQAPHLCSSIGTVLPCYSTIDVPLYWIGLKVYDILAAMGMGTLKHNSGYLSAEEAKAMLPSLSLTRSTGAGGNSTQQQQLKGGVIYYDGQMNDARLNVSVILTATKYGALCANYLSAARVDPGNVAEGKPCCITLKDENSCTTANNGSDSSSSSSSFKVYAKTVVNSTGPWTDHTRSLVERPESESERQRREDEVPLQQLMDENGGKLAIAKSQFSKDGVNDGINLGNTGGEAGSGETREEKMKKKMQYRVQRSRGAHVTLPRKYCPGESGLIIPKTKDGRVVFLLPWQDVAIAGTTDTGLPKSFGEVPSDVQPTLNEVDFILDSLETYCDVKINDSDVKSVWCGMRPLALPAGVETAYAQEVKAARAANEKNQQLTVRDGSFDSHINNPVGQMNRAVDEDTRKVKPLKSVQGSGSPSSSSSSSQNVVREHVISCDPHSGILTITGGKWTTYRKMADDVMQSVYDSVPSLFASSSSLLKKPCSTDTIVLVGGDVKPGTRGFDDESQIKELVAASTKRGSSEGDSSSGSSVEDSTSAGKKKRWWWPFGGGRKTQTPTDENKNASSSITSLPPISEEQASYLLQQYGTKAFDLVQQERGEVASSMSRTTVAKEWDRKRLHPEFPLSREEVRYLARHEQACRVSDVLSRRTRIAFQDAKAAIDLIQPVADVLAEEHKWSSGEKQRQIELAEEHLSQFDLRAIPRPLPGDDEAQHTSSAAVATAAGQSMATAKVDDHSNDPH